jgi:ABC-type branched-subunit amino acid transport system ATPase component
VSLRVENVTVRFGGVVALDAVTFDAQPSEVLGVIGPNGAGKTTLFNVISGLQRPTTGTVSLDAHMLTHLPMHRVAALGVTRTFQTPVMFWGLSACESIQVALDARSRGAGTEEAAHALLTGTSLASRADVLTESLTFGQERVLEILRALAVEPKVLLLDEPLSGLSGDEMDSVLELVRSARSRGVCILFVEHDLHRLLAAADRFIVLDHGRKIAEGSPDAVCNDPVVLDAYIGDELTA